MDLILQNSALNFSGHIFADTDDFNKAENLFISTKELFETFGFEISDEGKIKQGSWFKEKVVYKIRNVFRSKEAKELFDKTKRAIELQQIEKHQAEVNRNNFEAVAAFLNSVKEIPNVAVIMGSLIVAKATVNDVPQLAIQSLTTEQVILIEKNPVLKNNPLELLRIINNEGNKKLK